MKRNSRGLGGNPPSGVKHDGNRTRKPKPFGIAFAVFGILLAFVVFGAAGCGSSADDQGTDAAGDDLNLKIGFAGDLSGELAFIDVPMLNGMKFAADEINASDMGVNVEIVTRDNQNDTTLVSTTTQELLDEGIDVFVLTTADNATASGQLIAQSGGVVSLGDNTAPQILEDVGDRSFMPLFSDNVQASAAAAYACDQGYKAAYTIGSPEIPYTENLPKYFAQAFEEVCDGKVVAADTWQFGETNFSALVTKIQSAPQETDVIYTPMFPPDLPAFIKQLRSAGVDLPVVESDSAHNEFFLKAAGSAAEGMTFTTHTFASPGSPAAKFDAAFEAATGKPPESSIIEAIGRDNIYILAEAAKQAGATDADSVMEGVMGLKDYPTVTGPLTMDPDTRIANKDVFLVTVEDGEFKLVDQMQPEVVVEP